MKTDPNAASFAAPGDDRGPGTYGLTKLEYFTAAALTGVLAADPAGDLKPEQSARIAVRVARAVIAELNAEAGA